MPRIPMALQSYRHRSLPVSAQRIINWCAEQEPRDAKAPVILIPTPGLDVFTTLPAGPFRGAQVMGNLCYIVADDTVYAVDTSGAYTALGTLAAGGAVSMANNGTQMVVVVPETQQAWIATPATLTQITDADFPGAATVAYLNGFMVFSRPDSTSFFWSALNDAATYDALDFASAESAPDAIVAVRRIGDFLWFFGTDSIEIWSGSTQGDVPFTELAGGLVPQGCGSRFSIADYNNNPFWLGANRVVYRGEGASAQRISTHAIEQAIAGYETVSDSRGWIYEQEGHTFYVLTFPDAGETWVYDLATQSWHERESEPVQYNGTWRAIGGVSFGGATLAGDSVDGRISVVDPTFPTEDGDPIIRTAVGAPLYNEGKRLFLSKLEADMETGVGTVSGLGSAPKVWLSVSDDGGRTFGYDHEASLGAMGQYRTRVRWLRLGTSRERVFRIQMSDPVRTTLIAANFDAVPGAS